MSQTTPTPAPGASVLMSSLHEELEELRQRFQRALPLLGLLLLPAAIIQLVVDPTRGVAYLFMALCGAVLPLLLDDRRAPRLNVVLIALVPTVGGAVVQLTHGAFVAATSYLVPLLFCVCCTSVGFHLQPRRVALVGGLAVLFWTAGYALLVRPALSPAQLQSAPFDWSSHLTRMVFLTAVTLLCARGVALVVRLFEGAAARARAADLFAKYRLQRLIGRGGMGEVWAATYCPEGGFVRPVAVKMIQGRWAENRAFVDAFRREAELSARLQHKNIVQVHDFGREADRWFLSMEYVDGVTLDALLRALRRRGRALSPPLALFVAREIVEGIGYAHRAATDLSGNPLRVVHRDLAPQNVLLSRTGQVKVTDFGVAWVRGTSRALQAKARQPRGSSGAAEEEAACARPGGLPGVVGHWGYLSPEQARGEPADERSDLYAVGVLLWEMLAGKRFAPGRQKPGGPPRARPRVRPPHGPWDAVLARTLATSPRERFASARQLGDALSATLDVVGWPRERELSQLVIALQRGAGAPDDDDTEALSGTVTPLSTTDNDDGDDGDDGDNGDDGEDRGDGDAGPRRAPAAATAPGFVARWPAALLPLVR